MGVVELDRDLIRKGIPVVAPAPEPRHDIGQRAGDQEVFLQKAQVLSAWCRIIGIKDPRERLGCYLFMDGIEEVAAAKLDEVEILVGRGAPEPQRVDGPA